MITLTEAQLTAWLAPIFWPFIRVLALFSSLPVLGQRTVPVRVRVGLAFLIVVAAQASLPEMPVVALDSPLAVSLIAQNVLIGLTLGFAVRVVFAAVEFAGELIGLQMGLNYAGFFDPTSGGQGTATSRFFGTTVGFLFIVINAHLLVVAAVVQSFHAFPVGSEPFAFLRAMQPQTWGAEIFSIGSVDRLAADRHAAVRQPRARRHLARGLADQRLRDRLSDHARRRPRRHAADAADDAGAVHDGARAHARALSVKRSRDHLPIVTHSQIR